MKVHPGIYRMRNKQRAIITAISRYRWTRDGKPHEVIFADGEHLLGGNLCMWTTCGQYFLARRNRPHGFDLVKRIGPIPPRNR